MLKFSRHLIVLVLLLVVPLQGVAASFADPFCSSEPSSTEAGPTDDHGAQAVAPHDHDRSGDDSHAAHFCCHHFFSAAVTVMLDLDGIGSADFEPSPPRSIALFFPEQPLRVPVA